ncbi:MAG TPA: hypothetical protein VGQ73_06765, partial [Gemmatimonadales bacterium]|nr:hypothetical protein [Gemmatimonadales bacterium]
MTRSMTAGKRAVGFLLLYGILFTACKSSTGPSGGSYYLRFNANGTLVNFTAQPSLLCAFGQSGSQYNALITGFDATSNASVQLFDGTPIAQKSYSGYTIIGTAFVGVLLTYQDATGVVYSSGSGANTGTATITQLTATTVTGTFTGTLVANGHPNLAVSNGQFYVK